MSEQNPESASRPASESSIGGLKTQLTYDRDEFEKSDFEGIQAAVESINTAHVLDLVGQLRAAIAVIRDEQDRVHAMAQEANFNAGFASLALLHTTEGSNNDLVSRARSAAVAHDADAQAVDDATGKMTRSNNSDPMKAAELAANMIEVHLGSAELAWAGVVQAIGAAIASRQQVYEPLDDYINFI